MKFYQEVRSRMGGRALGFDYIFNYLNTADSSTKCNVDQPKVGG
jgi:hypothetical protein